MVDSVGATALLSIAGKNSNSGFTATLSIAANQTVSAIGNTVAFSLSAKTTVASQVLGPELDITVSDASPDFLTTIVNLGQVWQFKTDPTNTGVTSGWYGDTFDDSTWGTMNSDASWESQGLAYHGYAWYRQTLSLPFQFANRPCTITLASIIGDDDFYFNGVRIGGVKGNGKYFNIRSRVYTVPANLIRITTPNTLAIRTWSGASNGVRNSGLIAGTYTAKVDYTRVCARDVGAAISTEVPIENYDLTDAQRGVPFELIIHVFQSDVAAETTPGVIYTITDFYSTTLASGTTTITLGADGTYRGVVSVNAALAQRIYVAGRFNVQYQVVDLVGATPWTDTGNQIGSDTDTVLQRVFSQTFAAGTIDLPVQDSGSISTMYTVIIPDTDVVISNLVVNDTANAVNWSIQSDLQVGSLLYGSSTGVTHFVSSMTAYQGSQYIRTSVLSRSFASATLPIASFTIDRTATIYIAVDKRVVIPQIKYGVLPTWVRTGETIGLADSGAIANAYTRRFSAGTVYFPAQGQGGATTMYLIIIPDTDVVLSSLVCNDHDHEQGWYIGSNMQVGSLAYGTITIDHFISSMSAYQGSQYILTAVLSKAVTINPIASVNIDRETDIIIGLDRRVPRLPWVRSYTADYLTFTKRDTIGLSALSTTFEDTPYGNLKLIDVITPATDLLTEVHPYLQGNFGGTHLQDDDTPGPPVTTTVDSILGKNARQSDHGWFAYKIGRGTMTTGQTYLLRIEYPEDKPRYCPIEIEAGENYACPGWQTGVDSTIYPNDIYDPWPLSGAWQFYDVIVPLGKATLAAGGTSDGDPQHGFWVYLMNKRLQGFYYDPIYQGGVAVASIKLYEIDPVDNAPEVAALPGGVPQRVMTFDWERNETHVPEDIVNYAKLMGYSAVSPLAGIKWNFDNYGDPLSGLDIVSTDARDYYVRQVYTRDSGVPPVPVAPPSVHSRYLDATRTLGLDYIPRFEYGGSYDLPDTARSINTLGTLALPNRFAAWGANLLDPATLTDISTYLDSFIGDNAAANPQLKGAFWRIRSDRMQISYGHDDVVMFSTETGTPLPSGFGSYTPAQIGNWASTGVIGPAYSTWWQGKRRDFHQQIATLLQSYRADMSLYYYNWESDKFCLMGHDTTSGFFVGLVAQNGGPSAYATERAERASRTLADYINCFDQGDFSLAVFVTRPSPYPDYAMRPALYSNVSGMEIFAPVPRLPFATSGYINYFQTHDGVAVSNILEYDEQGSGQTNSKFECNTVTPARQYSMALELLSYFYGDARTLTYTSFNYGRGAALEHRKFAAAFRSLPAIPGTLVAGTPSNIAARVYTAGGNTYFGIAHKGLLPTNLDVSIPGTWPAAMNIRNLVTQEEFVGTRVAPSGNLRLTLDVDPMQLNSFLVLGEATLVAGPIDGATSATYVVAEEDVGFTIKVSVVATNLGGHSVPAVSADTAVVTE